MRSQTPQRFLQFPLVVFFFLNPAWLPALSTDTVEGGPGCAAGQTLRLLLCRKPPRRLEGLMELPSCVRNRPSQFVSSHAQGWVLRPREAGGGWWPLSGTEDMFAGRSSSFLVGRTLGGEDEEQDLTFLSTH